MKGRESDISLLKKAGPNLAEGRERERERESKQWRRKIDGEKKDTH